MSDPLLRALRDTVLDETEPLAGLLRKCMMLGAATGSTQLRDWARLELKGYDGETVPEYRRVPAAIVVDSVSGNNLVQGQTVSLLQIPPKARQYVPELVNLWQPIEELADFARRPTLNFGNSGLAAAQAAWNQELGMFQGIMTMKFALPGAAIAGVLGQVRTTLVELIADLTADAPLDALPTKARVDDVLRMHIGDVVHGTVVHSTGPTAVGESSTLNVGPSVAEMVAALQAIDIRRATEGSENAAELETAIAELSDALKVSAPDTGQVVTRAGRLRDVAARIGDSTVSSAVTSAVKAVVDHALAGGFN